MSIKTITTKILTLMGLVDPKISVVESDDETSIQIDISEPQTGALIGYHGETIAALQLILNLVCNNKPLIAQRKISKIAPDHQDTGSKFSPRSAGNQSKSAWKPVRVNVGDYRQRREAALTELAHTSATRAKSTGQDVILTALPSNERRLIHLALADDTKIETFSEGTGRFRRLVIRPKKTPQDS